ncbi:TPR repeat-containing protein NMB0313 precursor [Kingella potus]|uniref:TPR repeat-containing protein NMB0313 n=1 Tax=Kingella potus TaxID=265175 RepID=A0A377R2M0_9NEIS|nr:porin family protein [Kingella potus]STR02726.1 TPR repeat-containing protein NMB0313 precursor [Kingella potus]
MNPRLFFLPLLFAPLSVLADNEDTRLQLKYGIEARQQRQEGEKVGDLSFGTAAPQEADDLPLALMKAVNAQNEAETLRLLEIYKTQPDADPDMVLFAEANLALFRNDMQGAIALYRRLYQSNPQFVRAKLDLARLLFADKQNRESAALFAGTDIPERPAVNEKIQGFSAALAERDAWNGSLSLGAGYDSNINRSSAATILREQQSCGFDANGQPILDAHGNLTCRSEWLPVKTPDAIEGRAWAYEAAAGRRISLQGHHGIQFSGYALGRIYPQQREYAEHSVSLGSAYSFQNKDTSFSIGPQLQYDWSGGAMQDSNAGISASYSRTFAGKASLAVQAEHKYDRYRGGYRHFNGPQTLLFATAVYALTENAVLFGGYDYLRKNSREKVDSYRRHGLRLGLDKRFQSGIGATLLATLRQTAYQDYHAWLDTRRRDSERTMQIDLKYDRPALRGFIPVLSLKRTSNHSTSWVNRYKRNEITFKLQYAF